MKLFTKLAFAITVLTLISCKEVELIIESDELFVLDISFEGSIPKDDKISMNLLQTYNNDTVSYEGKIERRGGFSIQFPKHSYEFDLNVDVSIAELPQDDDWILNANYIDKTFIRHVISYELFMDMNDKNIASKSKYVEVNLNGVYNGLYVLMEKLDKSSLKINSDDTNAIIFKEPQIFRESYLGDIEINNGIFHQQIYPKIEINNKISFIEEIREFILLSSDYEFTNGISDIFDIDNIIDWHLLLLISNNSDGILKNFYFYKIDTETPIRIAPWDYDHSFGRDGDNELNIDERPLNIERSNLFKRLLQFDWYKTLLKERWNYLNNTNLLSVYSLKQRIITKSNSVREASNKNFEIWEIDNPWYYDSNNFNEEVEIMLTFIDLRHARISAYFEDL